jgi:hypothetical protein
VGDVECDFFVSGLTQLDNFWGTLRPKNYPTALGFRSQCVSPMCIDPGNSTSNLEKLRYVYQLRAKSVEGDLSRSAFWPCTIDFSAFDFCIIDSHRIGAVFS